MIGWRSFHLSHRLLRSLSKLPRRFARSLSLTHAHTLSRFLCPALSVSVASCISRLFLSCNLPSLSFPLTDIYSDADLLGRSGDRETPHDHTSGRAYGSLSSAASLCQNAAGRTRGEPCCVYVPVFDALSLYVRLCLSVSLLPLSGDFTPADCVLS